MRQIKIKLVAIIDQLYNIILSGVNIVKISILPIYWTRILSYIGILKKKPWKLCGMNITRFFLWKNIFFFLSNDILNQNRNISKIDIYHPPAFLAHKKFHISELFSPIFTNLPRMSENKFYGKKMKL